MAYDYTDDNDWQARDRADAICAENDKHQKNIQDMAEVMRNEFLKISGIDASDFTAALDDMLVDLKRTMPDVHEILEGMN